MERFLQVARYFSSLGKVTGKLPDKTGIAVCTIEKANSLITRMIEDGTLASTFSAVIVDELHMVDDDNRGYLLELLLTKLLHVHKQSERAAAARRAAAPEPGTAPAVEAGGRAPMEGVETEVQGKGMVTQLLGSAETGASQDSGVQLIGMSATLPNISLVAKWLEAELFETSFRPVRHHVGPLADTLPSESLTLSERWAQCRFNSQLAWLWASSFALRCALQASRATSPGRKKLSTPAHGIGRKTYRTASAS